MLLSMLCFLVTLLLLMPLETRVDASMSTNQEATRNSAVAALAAAVPSRQKLGLD